MGCRKLTYNEFLPTLKVVHSDLRISSNSCADDYRYGFQGQETDDEIKGEGNAVNYKYRMHDARIGRFFAIDPLAPKYPHNSPYAFSENDVIASVELEGLERVYAADGKKLLGQIGNSSEMRTANVGADEGEVKKYINWTNDTENTGRTDAHEYNKNQVIGMSSLLSSASDDVVKNVVSLVYGDIGFKSKSMQLNGIDFKAPVTEDAHIDPESKQLSLNRLSQVGTQDGGLSLLIDHYYNLQNTLYHESRHLYYFLKTGLHYGENDFLHFQIWSDQVSHSSFSKTSQGWQTIRGLNLGMMYLDGMRNSIVKWNSKDIGLTANQAMQTSFYNKYESNYQKYYNFYPSNSNKIQMKRQTSSGFMMELLKFEGLK